MNTKNLTDTCLIIIDFKTKENIQDFIEQLRSSKKEIPVIITCDENSQNRARRSFPYHALTQVVSYNLNAKVLENVILRMTNLGEKLVSDRKGYFQIPIKYLKNLPKTPYDLYIQISENKYIKVLRKGDVIVDQDYYKYADKNLQFLNMKYDDFSDFSQRIVKTLQEKLQVKNLRSKDLIKLTSLAHENFYQMVNKLGLSDESLKMADVAVDSMIQINKKNEFFMKTLEDFMAKNNYITEHSLMVSFVSIAIAREIEYVSDLTAQKLAIASFFHDISVKDVELAQLREVDLEDNKYFSEAKLHEYILHPHKSADLLNKLEGVPPDVDRIIKHHHENPRGTGFPHKLNYKKIDSLSAIFIVAEAFADAVYNSGIDNLYVHDILLELDGQYQDGNFKNAMIGLKKIYQCYKKENNRSVA